MVITSCLLLNVFISINIYAQDYSLNLDSLEVRNNNLVIIIDSIIEIEKQCSYFSESLYFGIEIDSFKTDTQFLSVSSNLSKDVILKKIIQLVNDNYNL